VNSRIITRVIPADGGSGLVRELARCDAKPASPLGATGLVATCLTPSAIKLIPAHRPDDVTVALGTGRLVAFGTRGGLFRWLEERRGVHPFFDGAVRAMTFAARGSFEIPCPGGALRLGRRTAVMGILNVTPDSFSDGGDFFEKSRAREHALQMADDGADIIDIGGVSTRPGSDPVALAEERSRVIPVIEALAGVLPVPISIDTCCAGVAREAIRAGAAIVNDVTALGGDPEMVDVIAEAGVPVILMHMRGTPKNMQKEPRYDDLMDDVTRHFTKALHLARRRGVGADKLIVDPGIGFGKTLAHNLELLDRLGEFRSLGTPIMVGTSRKSFIGMTTGAPVERRLAGSAASVALAVARGAHIIRVHDVAEMVQAVGIADAITRGEVCRESVWVPCKDMGAS